MKNQLIVLIFLMPFLSLAQNLYIPSNATIGIANGAEVHAEGVILNNGLISATGTGGVSSGRDINNNGIITVTTGDVTIDGDLHNVNQLTVNSGSQFVVAGDLTNENLLSLGPQTHLSIGRDMINDGNLISAGEISISGNWTNNNITNLSDASIRFTGSGDQVMNEVSSSQLLLNGITMASGGTTTITSQDVMVSSSLDFQSGILQPGTNTRVIMEGDAEASGGFTNAYYNGTLIYRGTGYQYFPVGNNGHFGPIELDNIYGTDPEIAVSHLWTNPDDPIPGEDLIGVSSNGLWQVERLSGTFDSSKVFLDFIDEDLENFVISNDFDASYTSPAVANADSMGGVFLSLGVELLENTDSLTYGRILSDAPLTFSDTSDIRYIAIAKAPLVPPEGVVYIPEVFSPNATALENQTFRFFGERISSDGFLMQVFNRRRVKVYETSSFEMANTEGWDGTHNNYPEPSGTYYYRINFSIVRLDGTIEERQESGEVYLIR